MSDDLAKTIIGIAFVAWVLCVAAGAWFDTLPRSAFYNPDPP